MSAPDEPGELETRRLDAAAEPVENRSRGEPARRRLPADCRAVAAVPPRLCVRAQPCGHWIPDDIEDGCDEMRVALDPDAVEAVAQQVAGRSVPAAGAPRVISVDFP